MRCSVMATFLAALPLAFLAGLARGEELVKPEAAEAPGFPAEFVFDTAAYPDESLVNVKVVNHRWPDCDTLQSIARDIFRVEGVNDTEAESEAKAIALWKWFRVLMCNSIPHAFEGPLDKAERQREAHKSLTVYGHHECGGLSSVMSALWRAAGYIGYKESSHGHSTVVLRYADGDGTWRMHGFDPMGGFLWWDAANRRIGVRTCPVMQGTVFRVLDPVSDHTLRTSLLWGQRLVRQWDSENTVLRNTPPTFESKFFETTIHEAVAGLEVQVLEADLTPESYARPLWKDSANVACSAAAEDRAALHPAEAGKPAAFIYRLPSPYVAVEAVCEARLRKGAADDVCRLSFSTDQGKTWNLCFDKQAVGKEEARLDIGNKLYLEKKPAVTSNYAFLVKAEFQAGQDTARTGLDGLRITVKRQLNKRCLMNLLPGENVIRVSADRLAPGTALALEVNYVVNGQAATVAKTIDRFPFYFRINVEGVSDDHLKTMRSKVTTFNAPSWPLRMRSIGMRLIDAKTAQVDKSLPAAEAGPFFKAKCPHPFDPLKNPGGTAATRGVGDEAALGGFLPQRPKPEARDLSVQEKAKLDELVGNIKRWSNAEALGAYPEAVDALVKALPAADGDLTIYICKALAQLGDRKTVPALLDKWDRRLQDSAPGSRYIPDALAACGDQSAVPGLLKPLRKLRLDYRFHVIHALGALGGSQAKEALEYLAGNDPHYANRALAADFLKRGIPADRH
ncbi:MAG TPA: HEAT repeat domain-containing protein [Planctomycetota bacterium]|nr:HEAT repeat domain-containing protein [Planctomycetota bacterium]